MVAGVCVGLPLLSQDFDSLLVTQTLPLYIFINSAVISSHTE